MAGKQKTSLVFWRALLFLAFLPVLTASIATAQEQPRDGGTLQSVENPEQAIATFLSAVQERRRGDVTAILTADAAEKWGSSPRVIMNTLRLTHHVVYDHDHYRLLEPAAAGDSGATAVRQIQLFDRDGGVTLAIIRLVRTGTGAASNPKWRIDGLTLVASDDQRGV